MHAVHGDTPVMASGAILALFVRLDHIAEGYVSRLLHTSIEHVKHNRSGMGWCCGLVPVNQTVY